MFALALLIAAHWTDPVAGSWEGSSLCTVKPSPCHDEHVIYRISATQPRHYRVDAYKLVAGKEDFMGAIDVTLDAEGADLDGAVISGGQFRGRLHMTLKGRHLSGRMTKSNGTLYRLIEADKR